MFKKSLISMCIVLSISSVTIASEQQVNDYDCTVEELKSYIGKKTEGLVQRKTTIPKFKEFVKRNTERTSAASAGAPVTGTGGAAEEDCNYFWGDLEKVKYENKVDNDIISAILSGDISAILNKSKERVYDIATGMAEEIQKGLCERLSTDNVMDTVYDYGDEALEKATGGYDYGDVTDVNGMINGELRGSYGSVGKLINVFDPDLDRNRSRAILKETDRQVESMILY